MAVKKSRKQIKNKPAINLLQLIEFLNPIKKKFNTYAGQKGDNIRRSIFADLTLKYFDKPFNFIFFKAHSFLNLLYVYLKVDKQISYFFLIYLSTKSTLLRLCDALEQSLRIRLNIAYTKKNK